MKRDRAPTRRGLLLGGVAALSLSACSRARPAAQRALRGAAASDLEPAFTELGTEFTAQTGRPVVWSFASSGSLAQQLAHGAPFDLFASASTELVARLGAQDRLVRGSQRDFARGRLALWTRPGIAAPRTLLELARPDLLRIALANPEHAPYGQAAVAALQRCGLYDRLRPRLVFAENVRQALQFAQTGNTDVALTALTLARRGGTYYEIPESEHPPLIATLAVIRGGDEPGGMQLADFICGAAGQATLRRHGFAPAT